MYYPLSVGLDVHKSSISACAINRKTGEIVQKRFDYDPDSIAVWIKSFKEEALCVYESGFCGFDLYHQLRRRDIHCEICATSKIAKPAGDKVKTDKRDAKFLAQQLTARNLVFCWIPTLEQEGIRDMARRYLTVTDQLSAAKQRVTKMCLRYGLRYDCTSFTKDFWRWAKQVEFPSTFARQTFGELLDEVDETVRKKETLRLQCMALVKAGIYAREVKVLSCLKGLSPMSVFLIMAELGDLCRFRSAASLPAYLGLIPSEASSGQSRHTGAITKCGNNNVRKILVEAAWTYCRVAHCRKEIDADISAKTAAEIRFQARKLTNKRQALAKGGKQACKANVATAREMASAIWRIWKVEGKNTAHTDFIDI